jgi:hypothetical protein
MPKAFYGVRQLSVYDLSLAYCNAAVTTVRWCGSRFLEYLMKEPWQYLKSSIPQTEATPCVFASVRLLRRRRSIAGELYRPLQGRGASMVSAGI